MFRREVERVGKSIHDLRNDLQQQLPTFASKDDVDSLRRALYTTALSVTGSVVVFAITMLLVYR